MSFLVGDVLKAETNISLPDDRTIHENALLRVEDTLIDGYVLKVIYGGPPVSIVVNKLMVDKMFSKIM